MRLSQKGEYGLLALLELARRYGEGPVQSHTIATRREIPVQFLHQILLALRRGGLVRSERGPRGGHELARPPAEVTLLEAVEILEGSSAPASCAGSDANTSCLERDRCALVEVWQEIDRATREILRGVTLLDLARREQERQASPMYFI